MFLMFVDDDAAAERFAGVVQAGIRSPAQVQERLLKATTLDEAIALFEDSIVPLRQVA